MQMSFGGSLCRCLGLLGLLAGVLVSAVHAQSGIGSSLASSPLAKVSSPGRPTEHQRVLPSRMEQVKAALARFSQTSAHPASSRGTRDAALANGMASPNFGGFSGNVPTFPVAHVVDTSSAGGYSVLAYDVSSTVAGDFNGDGKPDVAVIQIDSSIDVLLGDGKGGFSAPVLTKGSNAVGFASDAVMAVDLNGDGKQDLVGYSGTAGNVLVWLSKGDGTFAPSTAPAYSFPSMTPAFTVSDVNGDGHPDLLIISDSGSTPDRIVIQALLNDGTGNFAAAKSIPTTVYTMPAGYTASVFSKTASVVPFNGKPTLLFAAEEAGLYSAPYSAEVFEAASNGDGTFTFAAQPIDIPSVFGGNLDFQYSGAGTFMLVQDLNGDGEPDILLDPGDASIYTALGTGNGSFSVPVSAYSQVIFTAPNLAAIDLDGDGIADLVDAENGYLAAFHGNGDGTFALVNASVEGARGNSGGFSAYLNSTAFGDFNGDGKMDYVSVDNEYGVAGFYAGHGDFDFSAAQRVVDSGVSDQLPAVPPQLYVQAALDIDADGKTDLVGFNERYDATGSSLQVVSGINQGGGGFKWAPNPNLLKVPLGEVAISHATGDFNHDGKQDFILYGAEGAYPLCYNWHAYAVLSNGDGSFQDPAEIVLPNQPSCPNQLQDFAIADVNGDGNPDIVFTYGDPGYSFIIGQGVPSGFYVALGDGTGKFPTVNFVPYGTSLDLVILADFNGDGVPDLALSNFPNGTFPSVSILLNDGKGNFDGSSAKPVTATEYAVYMLAGDINQDGKQDLVLSSGGAYDASLPGVDSSQSGIMVYPGNGDGTVGEPTVMDPGQGTDITLADFNGDGLPDILSLFSYDFSVNPPSTTDAYYGASLLLNTGGGSFAKPVNMYAPYGVTQIFPGNYYGDGVTDFVAVDGAGASLFFNQGGSQLALTVSGNSVLQGDTVALTARVTASLPSRPTPSGTVAFYDGGTALGTASLDSSGVAVYSLNALSVGGHSITAKYGGDANFNPAVPSSSVAVTVGALPPSFVLAAASSTVTVSQTSPGSVQLTLTPNATFSGAVTLAVTGLPTGVTAQFSSSSLQLAAGQTGQSTLTLSESKTSASTEGGSSPWLKTGTSISVAGLLLLWIPRRRRMPRVLMLFAVFGFLAAGASLTGCGSGNSGSGLKSGTMAQITITATPAGSAATPQSTTMTITIQ